MVIKMLTLIIHMNESVKFERRELLVDLLALGR